MHFKQYVHPGRPAAFHWLADVEVELQDIKDAAVAARSTKVNPWRAIFSRKFTPQLVTIVALQVFNQLDGINSIMFYAPQVGGDHGRRYTANLQQLLCPVCK